MLLKEEYINHFKHELWPVLKELDAFRRKTLNTIYIGKLFFYSSIIIVVCILFFAEKIKLPMNIEDARIAVWLYLMYFLYFPGNFILISLIKHEYLVHDYTLNETSKNNSWVIFILISVVLLFIIWRIEPAFTFFLTNASNHFIFIPIYLITMGSATLVDKVMPIFSTKHYKLAKSVIIPNILSYHHPNFKYNPKSFVSSNQFFKSGLFNKAFITDYSGSDLAYGETGYGNFCFSQVSLRLRTKYGKFGKTSLPDVKFFQGVIYITDFNKKISGKTVIYPDFARRAFGDILGESINKISTFNADQLVMLEDVEFEKEFAVYSTDQVEARYILSPTMIEKLKSLQRQLKHEMYFSFTGNKMYILINTGYDLFISDINRSLLNYDAVKGIYETIGSIVEFTRYLSPEIDAVG
jgi:hypothetical protein